MKPGHPRPAAEIPAPARPGTAGSPAAARDEARLLLEQKFQALNQLSGNIAHEFNNIIAGILGSAELVAMDIHEGHPAHESLKQIFEASNRGREFLSKVRAFAQRQPVDRKPVSLPPTIEESLQILRGVIPDKVELQFRSHPGCPKVNADAAQFQQVILDLCLYCWQGLHERRGLITLTLADGPLEKRFSAMLPPGDYLHLVIQDDSQGLEPHALKKIFDPFHNRRTSKKIGLELFLARETIHAHQGELVAESSPGHGLAFHILLPALPHS
ncbi:MAG TPA: ATP-binding protein [Candidatus Acidoferrales bacterium]|nr:ATP-binding protein [Candidatus Acidoferrales bacterium]